MAKGNQCYYCGVTLKKGKNKTKEHIPPKMFFNAFDCDSITVPSCSEHNMSKAGDDQVFISGFIQSLNEGLDDRKNISYLQMS
jgi:hypothetical protein